MGLDKRAEGPVYTREQMEEQRREIDISDGVCSECYAIETAKIEARRPLREAAAAALKTISQTRTERIRNHAEHADLFQDSPGG